MKRRVFPLGAMGGGGLLVSSRVLPGVTTTSALPVSADEQRQMILGLRPPTRTRPVVAILADSRGSETTDLMVPYAVLMRSGVADVVVVAPDRTPITMMPALSIEPQATLDAFDQANPDGAVLTEEIPPSHVAVLQSHNG